MNVFCSYLTALCRIENVHVLLNSTGLQGPVRLVQRVENRKSWLPPALSTRSAFYMTPYLTNHRTASAAVLKNSLVSPVVVKSARSVQMMKSSWCLAAGNQCVLSRKNR